MLFGKNSKALNRLLQWDFTDDLASSHNIDRKHKELMRSYTSFFNDFVRDFKDIKTISDQLEGIIEGVLDSSNNVRDAAEHITNRAKGNWKTSAGARPLPICLRTRSPREHKSRKLANSPVIWGISAQTVRR